MRILSKLEQAGVVLMVVGVGLGFYGCRRGNAGLGAAFAESRTVLEEVNDMAEITTSFKNINEAAQTAGTYWRLSADSFWIFLAGIGLFVVANRIEDRSRTRRRGEAAHAEPAPAAGGGESAIDRDDGQG